MSDLHRRLAQVGNLTVYRVRSVLRCVEVGTLRGLAADYQRIVGSKVNRVRLRAALETLQEVGDITFDLTGDGLTVAFCNATEQPADPGAPVDSPPPPAATPPVDAEPRDYPGKMTAEEWRNTPEGITEAERRQAELDAADAAARARSAPMPRAGRELVARLRREQEQREIEERRLFEDEDL